MKTIALCLVLVLGPACLWQIGAQEWTRFRGPNGTGITDAKTIPTQWTEADLNWKVPLPGVGHSSPVLWGDRIFVTATDDPAGAFSVLCLSAKDGSTIWRTDHPLTPYRQHRSNAFASSTPALDADRVYVYRVEQGRARLLALDHQGKTIWDKDVGPFAAQHGAGTSPIVHDGMVILANEHDGESFVIAMHSSTGETRWKTPRRTSEAAYSTPFLYQPKNGPAALVFNSESHGISALAPDTGRLLWEYAAAFDKRSVSSPILAAGLLVGSCGSGGGGNYVVAVRPGEAGKNPELAYEIRRSAPYVPTSICVGDNLFLWSDGGVVSCVDAPTGEVKWQERVGGNFFCSPICVDGRLFCTSTTGEVVVLAATDRFEVLARNPLNELTHSTPAVAGGRIYIRTSRHLHSIGGVKTGISDQ